MVPSLHSVIAVMTARSEHLAAMAADAGLQDLQPFAHANCYGCLGTGKGVGFGQRGAPCGCVATCRECYMPFAWGHDDESAPDLCPICEAEARK